VSDSPTIYEEINAFLDSEEPAVNYFICASDLVRFANGLLERRPSERRFIQDWFLNIMVTRFSGKLFDDVVLVRQHSFSFDPKPLDARRDSR